MCGLTLSVTLAGLAPDESTQLARSLEASNAARGPNAHGVYARRIPTPYGAALVTLAASVLGLRGGVTAQPLVGRRGALGWNGQVFSGLDVGIEENDTRKIFNRLEEGEDVLEVLGEVEGPWAFVYISFETGIITFGVDPLSRRSLLLHADGGRLFLSSTRSAQARVEGVEMRALDGGEVGVIDLRELGVSENGDADWSRALTLFHLPTKVAPVNRSLPTVDVPGFEAIDAEVDTFLAQLTTSVRRRVENIPAPAPGSARIALLFSGGVDCTLLAALVHAVLAPGEPIELVNVAFALPPKAPSRGQKTPSAVPSYDVPDRVSGREALGELRAACPGREWRFVEVDVGVEEARGRRQEVVDAMYPSGTEMDLSLAYPLFFASLGVGAIATGEGREGRKPYTVSAKVYISGLGADEQLAGYTRHRKAYERRGWPGVIDEIQLDLDRLPQRNLSRDDRVLSAHARDARYPYLDLGFVGYVSSLPAWVKCNLSAAAGEGDKSLIRLAALRCGLPATARRVKRAMQFGTKSAKLYEGGTGRGFRASEQAIIS